MLHAEFGGKLGGFAVERNCRASARQARHFAIAPAYAVAPARAQSLHGRFFSREARGVALHAIGLRIAIADFASGEDALYKALAKAFDRLPDARNLCDIDAGADDHNY